MTRSQYITFTKELVANGYQFRKDCPYQGRNKWVKYPLKTTDARIDLDLYKHIDDTGEDKYVLKPVITIKQDDQDCDIHFMIHFKTADLAHIERIFHKYVEKLK